MRKFKVELARVDWITVTVEAEDEEEALDKVMEEGVRGLCAYCSGYGPESDTVISADDPVPIDEFHKGWRQAYDEETDGKVVTEVTE